MTIGLNYLSTRTIEKWKEVLLIKKNMLEFVTKYGAVSRFYSIFNMSRYAVTGHVYISCDILSIPL